MTSSNRDEHDVNELGFRVANGIAWENQADADRARNGIALRCEQAQWAAEDKR